MKITFFSNFLNHHQLPFCLEMNKKANVEFRFVATEAIPEERLKLGYENMNSSYDFVIRAYESEEEYQRALALAYESDVVIIGSAPEILIQKRLEENKLTFRYSERVLKKGLWRILNPRLYRNLYKIHTVYKNKELYLLCASAYTAGDFSLVGAYPQKAYKWGYFPEVKEYDIENLIPNKPKEISILWVGRYLNWKHPEIVVKLAKRLKKRGYQFKINMIGTGPLEEKIKQKVVRQKLEDCVHILGSKPNEQVRKQMEMANIFLFTSDRNEGWGAVLNEAMNSGCAIVADELIGAVPFLIQDGVNGFIYKDKSLKSLTQKVEKLIQDKELRERLAKNAYQTLMTTWNAQTAAEHLMILINNIQNKQNISIKEGPCSKAEILIR